jgi:hypothetical protein
VDAFFGDETIGSFGGSGQSSFGGSGQSSFGGSGQSSFGGLGQSSFGGSGQSSSGGSEHSDFLAGAESFFKEDRELSGSDPSEKTFVDSLVGAPDLQNVQSHRFITIVTKITFKKTGKGCPASLPSSGADDMTIDTAHYLHPKVKEVDIRVIFVSCRRCGSGSCWKATVTIRRLSNIPRCTEVFI